MKGMARAMALGTASMTLVAAAPVEPDPEAEGVAQLVTAAGVAAWGRRVQDPGALILAARMAGEVPVRVEGEAQPFFTANALLDEALAMSGNDPAYARAIETVRGEVTRGVVSSPYGRGPIATVKTLRGQERHAFDVQARGGEMLRVAAIGDGDTDVDLSLADASGRALCVDDSADHYPVCTIRVRQAARLRVEVVNGGRIWTRVQILSN